MNKIYIKAIIPSALLGFILISLVGSGHSETLDKFKPEILELSKSETSYFPTEYSGSSNIVFSPDVYVYQDSSVPFNGKQIILLHGLRGTHNDLFSVPAYDKFINDVLAKGWRVIMFDLPFAESYFFEDGGTAYNQAYVEKLHQTMKYLDEQYHDFDLTVLGGISWGGLHSLIGAEEVHVFKGYFAILPDIKIGALTEFAGMIVPDFTPDKGSLDLQDLRGYIAFNTTDERVHYEDTVDFVNSLEDISALLKLRIYDSGGHTITGNLDYLVIWLEKTFKREIFYHNFQNDESPIRDRALEN